MKRRGPWVGLGLGLGIISLFKSIMLGETFPPRQNRGGLVLDQSATRGNGATISFTGDLS